jgi:ketosteroid isomerase-like protein
MSTWYEEYLASWDEVDVDAVMAWFTDDVVYRDMTIGHGAKGAAQMRKFVEASFQNVPEARFEFVRGKELDDGYAIEWIMHPMGVAGASIGKRRDGKICENRDYWNGAEVKIPNT